MADVARYDRAIAAFDAANARDPTVLTVNGVERPKELVFAERLSAWVARLEPDASEPLRLAARCQHLRRWEIPRTSYPDGRIGYLEWRKELSRFHARSAAAILTAEGYDATTIEHVSRINQKKSMKLDADVQVMEDALCLSFLEFEFAEFAAKHADDKIVDIVQKTWRKMSDRAHQVALTLPFEGHAKTLVLRALEPIP
jgi:hypothetical protein